MTDPVIEIRDVVKRFGTDERGVTALNRLNVRVAPRQVTGLVGPDGAGKTTLMRLVAGILRPDSGSIHVFGRDSIREAAAIQASIGYMPQRFGLYEDLSVAENLSLYADLQGVAGDSRRRRFDELISFTGLGPFRRRLAGRLSGGMKQKLGLACTLIGQPRLLLLDEPSVGVDPVSRRELWNIVYSLVDQGIGVLWSTAYLDEAERCHDVILLNEGRLLMSGRPSRFTEQLRGRTYRIRLDPQNRREALVRAQRTAGVLDVIIKGSDLHLLLAKGTSPSDLRDLAPGEGPDKRIVSEAEPEFEDAFVALLKGSAPPGAPSEVAQGDKDVPTSRSPPPASHVTAGHDKTRTPPTAAGGSAVIEVADLVRDFGTFRAVDHIGFEVAQGEIFGLLGPNGAGKSTTFKMLCGLLPPSAGSARVLGIDLRRAAAIARGRIGYMAQKFSLYGDMSVNQNLRFFASAYGLKGGKRTSKIEWALDEFDLRRYGESNSRDLPLGYKQRLALACAIMHGPGVLFLDEPTSGVDPLVRRGFWTRINAMASAGVTVMVTTHFMDEAEYCDRIGIIYRGALIALGSPHQLRDQHSSADQPNPTLEDAFVNLIEGYDRDHLI
jgi:ABC-2 type transport system ATP-binding protein